MTTHLEVEYKQAPGITLNAFIEATDEIKPLEFGGLTFAVWDARLPNGRTMGSVGIFPPSVAAEILTEIRFPSGENWLLSSVKTFGESFTVPSSRFEDHSENQQVFQLNQHLQEKNLKVKLFSVQG
jgi:hypothetical protein